MRLGIFHYKTIADSIFIVNILRISYVEDNVISCWRCDCSIIAGWGYFSKNAGLDITNGSAVGGPIASLANYYYSPQDRFRLFIIP